MGKGIRRKGFSIGSLGSGRRGSKLNFREPVLAGFNDLREC